MASVEEKTESMTPEEDNKEKEVSAKERQFEAMMHQVQCEASLGRVTNLHPATRQKMKEELERSLEEELNGPPKKKAPSEDIQKVFTEKAEKKKAEKIKRLRASFLGNSSISEEEEPQNPQ